jgi:beta-N-acetylhexosaminidase
VDGIMTAHVALPALEPDPFRPATLSRAILVGLLRQRLGYEGLILTDSLDMAAIATARSTAEAAVEAFAAGADLLLVGGITAEDRARLAEGPRALLAAVRSGRISEARLDESVARVLALKATRGRASPAGPASPADADLDLPLTIARRAVTLLRDDGHLLPLHPAARLLVVEVAPRRALVEDEDEADEPVSSLLEAVRQLPPTMDGARLRPMVRGASPRLAGALAAGDDVDVVVLGLYDLARDPRARELVRTLAATGKPVIGVSLRTAYDADVAPEIGTFLAVYGDRPLHARVAAEALFGLVQPTRRRP